MKIELEVRGLGHCPSFKNNKRTIKLKNGSTMPVTDRRTKAWMQRCTESFVSQLLCATRTTDDGTLTETQPRSQIVSLLPLDDSRQWISELHITAEEVAPGEEGAVIVIEKINAESSHAGPVTPGLG